MNNFQIVNTDTDSISFCKPDRSFISLEERKAFIKDINDRSPEMMSWADDGYYSKVIVVAAKNYILQTEDGKIKYKGASIKAPTKPLALREFIKEIIAAILKNNTDYISIYNKYLKEILNVKEIKRWSDRKSLTSTTFSSQRSNERKIVDAIQGTEYVEGNRIWVFYKSDESLCLLENYDGDYSVNALLKKLYDTSQIFKDILDKKQFLNYTLKRNQGLLDEFRRNL